VHASRLSAQGPTTRGAKLLAALRPKHVTCLPLCQPPPLLVWVSQRASATDMSHTAHHSQHAPAVNSSP
jgi:hypothetical protein